MKHRLPQAKTSTVRLGNKTEMEQSELLIDEKKKTPSSSGANLSKGALPPPLPTKPQLNEASNPAPDESSSLLAEPPSKPSPMAEDNDSYGFLVDGPSANPISGVSAPLVVTKGNKIVPPPLPAISTVKATPPPLPAPAAKTTPLVSTEVAPVVSEESSVALPIIVENSHYIEASAHETPDVIHEVPENQPFLIQTQGLVKQYGGRRVVNGVDIHVKPGEVVGLLGKNGAGKTTTFYMIVGLVPPTLGHVFMGDEDVTHMPMYRRARRGIGYLPQEESIFRKLTVEENLLAILETLPMTEDERENRCDELLKDFGLEHVRESVAITLSGGEKRRVTIARALVTSPTLLLLDEPFSGVDPMAVHDIQEIILHLKERGLGVLITDHNVRETLSVVDRAYIIDEGRVLSTGTREFLLNDPIAREIYLGHRFSM